MDAAILTEGLTKEEQKLWFDWLSQIRQAPHTNKEPGTGRTQPKNPKDRGPLLRGDH